MMIGATDLQLEALARGFNLALGSAATTFSRLVSEPVHISVPSIELLTPAAMRERIAALYAQTGNTQLCGIEQSFELNAGMRADTLLVFAENGSLDIIRQMLGHETSIAQFTELEQDALAEIGNIITNSCMGSFAELLHLSMTGTLPTVRINDPFSLIPEDFGEDAILVAQIGLSLATKDTKGAVLFFMDGPTIQNFINSAEARLTAPLRGAP